MTGPGDLPLIRQYRDWLQGSPPEDSPDREDFFTNGIVALDTNVLLSLYEYTPLAREQILNALNKVQAQLWLPHQVGLEFVRGRHRVIAQRVKVIKDAPNLLNRQLGEANKAIIAARELVQTLLIKYARDTEKSDNLASKISSQAIDSLLSDWKEELLSLVKGLKDHDLAPASMDANDPVLPQVAELFGSNIAEPPAPEKIRQLVDEAATYRFPNKIPPGYSDAGKGTPASAAGDFLLWEELIEYMAEKPGQSRLLFVSSDTKDDWYQPGEAGRGRRPWPSLASELRIRSGAELRIETPGQFYRGINRFLNAEIGEATYEEIDRAAETANDLTVTEEMASFTSPPADLTLAACRAAGLSEALTPQSEVENRVMSWWLIGVTTQLERRSPLADEPKVSIDATTRSETPPNPHWLPGDSLRLGEWPYRSSTWIAPWFVHALNRTSIADRRILQSLAAQQLDSVDRTD
ncbi:PIN-like domain-containing protein [Streptomyces sp. NPDC091879]|uniref:PIN-like domain-containing protein n=1 Tax=Streptomyces sp. NPDC091879 TaxID=3366006 RepID=UPI00380A830B